MRLPLFLNKSIVSFVPRFGNFAINQYASSRDRSQFFPRSCEHREQPPKFEIPD